MDRITHWNPYVERLLGLKSQDVIGKQLVDSGLDWDWARVYEAISSCIVEDRPILLEDVIYHSKDGKVDLLEITVNPLKRSGEDLVGFILFGRDMTEQRKLENRLLQTRKLEAIGQLAAGVAHEINTPLQYVGDNLKFISKSLSGIIDLQYKLIQQRETSISGAGSREVSDSLKEYMHEIDLDYIVSELPKAVEQSIEGVLRVSKIVQSMKAFAHPGTGIKSPADINKSIENTATVSRNEWKYDCRLDLSLDPAMPLVSCYETELSQVVLNLIVNSVDAVKDAKKNGLIDQGIIRISTAVADNMAVICVEDNGQGIPDEIKHKIFDPFFTTKEVGKGTGQGLAIAHSIIVDKHGGQFEYAGEYGMGAVFIIRLPLYT
jgi:PAS domain S-box-containing protein